MYKLVRDIPRGVVHVRKPVADMEGRFANRAYLCRDELNDQILLTAFLLLIQDIMASNDVEVIEEIEKALGEPLPRVDKLRFFKNGYIADEQDQVTALSLPRTRLSDYSFLKELSALRTLYVSDNQISDISFLKELGQLQTLNLWGNQIRSLPDWITELPPEPVYPDSEYAYGKINLGNNPLTNPPPEIIKQGREAIRAYFKSLESGSVQLHEAKVLLVGDGKAGKTSLLKQFQGLPFDEHESQTHGINVKPLFGSEIAGFEHDDDDCRLHFW
ncbi:MAG: hypothetical protein D3904_07675, partial [Candidatus Electrothrix sp. EH2]|nr:hypothetical protein [Candidatus Electrothrix sp. EH2]